MIILRLCARCAAFLGQRYGKIRHSVCLRAFFLFEVYYCPMLFFKINVRKHSLFGILHSRKIEILNLKRLLLLKKRFKTRKIAVLV